MNRQITGTITLLIMLASMQLAAGQYAAPRLAGAGMAMAPPSAPMAAVSYPAPGVMNSPAAAPLPGYAMPGYAMPGYAVAGQAMPGQPMPGQPMPMGVPQPAAGLSYAVPAMMPPVYGPANAHPIQPATYGAPVSAGVASYGGYDTGCDAAGCDGAGCDGAGCCGSGGVMGHLGCWMSNLFGLGGCGGWKQGLYGHLHRHGPGGTGGCCKPRWFDVQAEWLYWKRDFDESQPLSFQGIAGQNLALDTNQLDFDYESGFRVSGAYLVGPGTAIEATYFDGFTWSDSAVVTGNQDLFSIFDLSPGGPFAETAFGNLHSVALSFEMNSGELNLRRRFVSANCCVHTSLLAGVRYFRLREDMIYETFTDEGSMSYQLKAGNDLIGSQVGGDLAICFSPRFKIGADVKAGVYGTHSTARTNVFCTSCDPIRELESASDVAFLGEGGAFALYQISPRWTLRAAYQVLYVDGIATAVENFNAESPLTARTPFIDNQGDAFVHGSNLGFEFTY